MFAFDLVRNGRLLHEPEWRFGGVNYSSIRAGLLEEREEWRSLQGWFVDHVLEPVFTEWLSYALVSDALELPAAKLSKFEEVSFVQRLWVDPLKDTQANILQIENGLKSRRGCAAEAGRDYEKTVEEIAQDNEIAAANGVELGEQPPPNPNSSE